MPDFITKELHRLRLAFGYSQKGFRAAWGEAAFRTESFACLVMVPLAFAIAPSGIALAMLLGSVLLVLIVELLNTAIEKTIDRISLERHPLSGAVKDMGSAAVLLALLNAAIVWICIVADI